MSKANVNDNQVFQLHDSPNQPDYYEIHVKGHLIPRWAEWFEGLTVKTLDDEVIILYGPVHDQAALHGLLAKIRDLNLTLINIKKISLRTS